MGTPPLSQRGKREGRIQNQRPSLHIFVATDLTQSSDEVPLGFIRDNP
jgi:hypothetical protein